MFEVSMIGCKKVGFQFYTYEERVWECVSKVLLVLGEIFT